MNLRLDSDGDLMIDKGTVRCSGNDFVAQLIKNRLKTLLGEWKLDNSIGIPWFTHLLRKNYSLDDIYGWIYKEVAATDGVKDIKFLKLVVNYERKLFVIFEVTSDYGTINNQVEV